MATRFIDKEVGADALTAIADNATGRAKVRNLPDAAGIVYDKVDNHFKFNAAGTIKSLVDSSDVEVAAVDDVTLEYSGGVVQVKDDGIDTTQLADGAVETAKIGANAVTSDKTTGLASGSIVIAGDGAYTVVNGLITAFTPE
jgi:hypothetical protein